MKTWAIIISLMVLAFASPCGADEAGQYGRSGVSPGIGSDHGGAIIIVAGRHGHGDVRGDRHREFVRDSRRQGDRHFRGDAHRRGPGYFFGYGFGYPFGYFGRPYGYDRHRYGHGYDRWPGRYGSPYRH